MACLRTNIDPLEVVLARLVAVDFIPIFKLENNVDIKNVWAAKNLKIPSNRHGMKKMLLEYCKNIKSSLMEDFDKLKKANKCFLYLLFEMIVKKLKDFNLNHNQDILQDVKEMR